MRTTTIAALMLVLTATSLSAQRTPRDAQHRGRAVAGEIGRSHKSPAVAMLRQRERLDLSAAQVRELTQLARAQRAEAPRSVKRVRAMEARAKARAVLTTEQRAKLRNTPRPPRRKG
jgi:Spy/CpxP family protein refolding chaperone